MVKKLIAKKKEAMSGSIVDMFGMIITITVIALLMMAQISFNYDFELKKSIERIVDTYTYTMESNGGLSAAEQANLIAELKDTYNDELHTGVIEVTLSGNALYGNAGQSTSPNEFNEPMELTVECTCNVYYTDAEAWNVFSNDLRTVTTRVKRRTISHGIY